jgi:hypothetical protein
MMQEKRMKKVTGIILLVMSGLSVLGAIWASDIELAWKLAFQGVPFLVAGGYPGFYD